MPIQPSTKPLTRRRMLSITAAAAGLPLLAYGVSRFARPRNELTAWSGAALGAEASLALWHADKLLSERMVAASLAEVARLERIFSLFDAQSELARLNRVGNRE